MTALNALLNSPLSHRLGITLLHSLWQGAAVLAAFSLAANAMRKASSHSRYAIASSAMLLLFAIPMMTFFVVSTPAVRNTDVAEQPAVKTVATPQPIAFNPIVNADPPRPIARVDSSFRGAIPAIKVQPTAPAVPLGERLSVAIPWIVLAWLAGVALLALRNIGGWIALQQLRSFTAVPAGEDVDRCMRKLAQRLGIQRSVRVLKSTFAKTPMVIGLFKPVILISTSAITTLSIAELESIFAHELAHIRRHDYLVNLLQALVETLLFYHPAVWVISSRVRQERENCCDDLALSVTRDRASYVRALAAVASIRVSSLVPAASGGKLLPRLQRLLGITDATSSRPSRWTAGIVVLMLITAGGLFSHLRAADSDAAKDDDIVWIHGHVLDPAGKPVASAHVMTTGYSFTAPISEAISEADGSYKISYRKSAFADVRFGGDATLVVAAVAPTFGPGWAKPDHAAADGELTLKLATDDVPLNGRLIDTEGTPVVGARVRVWSIHAKATDLSKLNIMRFDAGELPGDVPPDLDATAPLTSCFLAKGSRRASWKRIRNRLRLRRETSSPTSRSLRLFMDQRSTTSSSPAARSAAPCATLSRMSRLQA
jgi:beta-lactamase regulating signal transducer with metallopeptidase domain